MAVSKNYILHYTNVPAVEIKLYDRWWGLTRVLRERSAFCNLRWASASSCWSLSTHWHLALIRGMIKHLWTLKFKHKDEWIYPTSAYSAISLPTSTQCSFLNKTCHKVLCTCLFVSQIRILDMSKWDKACASSNPLLRSQLTHISSEEKLKWISTFVIEMASNTEQTLLIVPLALGPHTRRLSCQSQNCLDRT